MKRYLLLLLAVFLAAPSGRAQDDAHDARQMLFRGKVAQPYNFLYNGNFYWDSDPGYTPGDVFYNGRLYEDVLLNVDAFTDQLMVRPSSAYAPIYTDRDQVAWFTRKGSRYVNLRYQGVASAAPGFYRVLHDGDELLLERVQKVFESNPGDKNGEIIGFDDPDYNTKVITYFSYRRTCWLLRDGQLLPVKNARSLRKLFPDRKEEIRAAVRRWNLDPSDLSAYLAGVMDALDPVPARSGDALNRWHPGGGEGVQPELALAAPAGAGRTLPDGYFSPSAPTTAYEEPVQATYRNKVYEIGRAEDGAATEAELSGRVTDTDGHPLAGVVLQGERNDEFVRSRADGSYSIVLPVGDNVLVFSEPTKDELRLRIRLRGPGVFDVILPEKSTTLRAATITAESMAEHRTPKIGLEKVSMKTMNKIPSAFGEGDVIKAVMTLPGVQSVGEASTGFNVRGGAADQNLILFNENTIYNPSHLLGIFSAFNPDIVENVELYKSSIPAEYGGRISSVLNIHGKEGNPDKVKGSAGIGLLTSRLSLEGPLGGRRTTFVAGGRITYSDWLLRQLPRNSGYAGCSAGFGDLNLGVTHRFDADNVLRFSAYYARDRFGFQDDTTFRYRSLNASLSYRHRFEQDRSLTVSAGYDAFANQLDDATPLQSYHLQTAVRQVFLRAGMSDVRGDHTLTYGLQTVGYGFDPGRMDPWDIPSVDVNDNPSVTPSGIAPRVLPREYALEADAYFGDAWKLSDVLTLDGGVRLSGYAVLDPFKAYGGPEFRLSGKYSPRDNLSLKAGVNTMKQYIHLISNTAAISPMDTWKLSGDGVAPTDGYQAAAGVYWTVFNSQVDLSLEGYWKQMFRYSDYKSGATLVMNPDLASELVPVKGKAYGVELMARKSAGKLNGWVSYAYSRSLLREMQDRGAETIADGAWYPAAYDKPHDLKMALNYKFTHRYSLSVNLDYSTGRPVTVPEGMYRYQNGFRLVYSTRNAYRIPDYFRLDAAINIDPGHYLKALAHASLTIGVYNVTGRKNPYSVFFTTGHGTGVNGYMLSVFATQVPYINLNILF